MLEIPGYYYDEASNRYYKESSRRKRAPDEFTRETAEVKREQHKGSQQQPSTSKKHKKRHRGDDSAVTTPTLRIQQSSTVRLFDDLAASSISDIQAARDRFRHQLLSSSLTRLSLRQQESPELTIGDSITRFCLDDPDPDSLSPVVRYGSAFGLIGHGQVWSNEGADPSRPFGHSTTSWRADHVLGTPVTSLRTCNDRMLATTFGLPAKAVYASTSSEHSASIVLSPRKTSLWSSALSRDYLALGCDKKVLLTPDPTRAEMRSYGTGSAVFTLCAGGSGDAGETELYAGTRSGHVRMFDVRKRYEGGEDVDARPEILLRLPTSVTHVRVVSHFLLLVVLIDGSISMYDRRFLPFPSHKPVQPLKTLAGHVNTHTPQLGLAISANEDVLAAAGEDKRVRLWSLKTGSQLGSVSRKEAVMEAPARQESGEGLLDKIFEEPVEGLAFRESRMRGTELWLTDGPMLERYSV